MAYGRTSHDVDIPKAQAYAAALRTQMRDADADRVACLGREIERVRVMVETSQRAA